MRRLLATLVAVGLILASALVASADATPRGDWWHPAQHASWYWQLQGTPPARITAQVVDLDGFGTSAAEVGRLHARGKRVVCYIDVGTWENWRPDARRFPRSLLGNDNGWPGERWLDTRRLGVLRPIMTARLQMCRRKGFDAVEPDNFDSQGDDPGFPLTLAVQARYARFIAQTAHRLHMAVLQKNDPEQARTLEPSFDGVLTEQCNQYAECASFRPYLRAHKPVFDAEYEGRLYPGFCRNDRRLGINGVLYDLALDGRVDRPCPARRRG
jgi:hypothetical protein